MTSFADAIGETKIANRNNINSLIFIFTSSDYFHVVILVNLAPLK